MRAHIIGIILLCCTFVFSMCTPNKPTSYRGLPDVYQTAYEQVYGHCYDSVPYAVVSLDLYSEGLELNDSTHTIQGTGYNLFLSDIFVPDSLLETGAYRSDTSGEPFTFLPGRDYEGYPHGMYILNIENDKILQIQVLDSGSFVYRNDSLLFTLHFRNSYGSHAVYTCHFHGEPICQKP